MNIVENNNELMNDIFFQNYDNLNIDIELEDTEWFKDMKEIFELGINNTFIITGNIYDYAIPGFLVEEYIACKLINSFNIRRICTLDLVKVNNKLSSDIKECNGSFDSRFSNVLKLMNSDLDEENYNRKALIIKYPEYIFPNPNNNRGYDDSKYNLIKIHDIIMNECFRNSGNIIIILVDCKSKINPCLIESSTRTSHIEIPYPNKSERLDMIKYLRSTSKEIINLLDIENDEYLAHILAGYRNRNIEDLWKLASSTKCITGEMIEKIKQMFLSKEFDDLLDIVSPMKCNNIDSFGGMKKVKEFLREGVINKIKTGNIDCIPKGMLFMGPPGTGKTYLAKCIANESSISFVEIKMSKILSKWVGETEQNLEKALNCIKSLSPCFVFIDEIEQVIRRGDSDSNGVRSSVFQMFLNFMSANEHRGQIIWIGATNYPNRIDDALKRAGRFDIKFVFTHPLNIDEVKDVFIAQSNTIKDIEINISDCIEIDILNQLLGYSQAEIEYILRKAISLAFRENLSTVNKSHIEKSIQFIKKSSNENIEEMIKIAINECNDLEFLQEELIKKYIQ